MCVAGEPSAVFLVVLDPCTPLGLLTTVMGLVEGLLVRGLVEWFLPL